MKAIKKRLIFCGLLIFSLSQISAQDLNHDAVKRSKNIVGLYLGLIEYNVNYERNVLQRPKSHSNIRAGFGYWTNLQAEGNYVNAAWVQMFGKNSSHIEFNLGVKYVFDRTDDKNIVLPDLYAGYRYDNPGGRIMFRSGLSLTSLINVGFGVKL